MNYKNWKASMDKWKSGVEIIGKLIDVLASPCGFCREYRSTGKGVGGCDACPLHPLECTGEEGNKKAMFGRCLISLKTASFDANNLLHKIETLEPQEGKEEEK